MRPNFFHEEYKEPKLIYLWFLFSMIVIAGLIWNIQTWWDIFPIGSFERLQLILAWGLSLILCFWNIVNYIGSIVSFEEINKLIKTKWRVK